MLTYTPPDPRQPAKTHEKPWLLLLMAFAWLWPGVFSHDLWNPAEPTVFTAVEALDAGATPLVAHVLGQPDFQIPPVYLWVAAAFKHLLSPWAADAYDAARFAGVFFTIIGLTACGFAGFNFLGRHHGRSVVLILIGSIGLLSVAHFLNPASVAFAASGMILCGFSLAQRRVITSSLLLGGGWALLSLSSGYLMTAALMFLAPALLLDEKWRVKRYYLTLVGAFAIGLPLLTVYPLIFSRTQPELFSIWLQHHSLGALGGLGGFQTTFSLFYYLKNLLWFTLPAWPLAAWTLSRPRIREKNWSVLCISWFLIVLSILAVSPQRLQDNLVWLLPPLALLGAAQLDGLRRGGVYQLVRRHGVRIVRHFPVDGLLRHELRLACQTRRTRRLFQPVLHARHRPDTDGGRPAVYPVVAVGDYPQKHPRQTGSDQLGGRRYAGVGIADDPVPAVA